MVCAIVQRRRELTAYYKQWRHNNWHNESSSESQGFGTSSPTLRSPSMPCASSVQGYGVPPGSRAARPGQHTSPGLRICPAMPEFTLRPHSTALMFALVSACRHTMDRRRIQRETLWGECGGMCVRRTSIPTFQNYWDHIILIICFDDCTSYVLERFPLCLVWFPLIVPYTTLWAERYCHSTASCTY